MCVNLDVGGDDVPEGNCLRRKEQKLYHVCLFVLHVLKIQELWKLISDIEHIVQDSLFSGRGSSEHICHCLCLVQE
jgi:hypothetical protein